MHLLKNYLKFDLIYTSLMNPKKDEIIWIVSSYKINQI